MSMDENTRNPPRRYGVAEVTTLLCVEHEFVLHCLRAHWVLPAVPETVELDDADLARLRLILDLKEDFGVNDEAIPVILHLVDQLHGLRHRVRARKESSGDEGA